VRSERQPNFGKTIVTNHYDPALLNGFRPYNWATSAVVQHELTHGMALNVGYFRTSWYNQTATDALGVTPADFDPYCLTLPVDSRFPNGGGNTLCGLYNVKPDKFSSLSGTTSSPRPPTSEANRHLFRDGHDGCRATAKWHAAAGRREHRAAGHQRLRGHRFALGDGDGHL
jgi:hypothetical protein